MKKTKLLLFLLLLMSFSLSAQEGIHLIHGPYLQNIQANEVTIVWVADKPSVGWVELAPEDNTNFYETARPKYFDSVNGVKKTSTVHFVRISGLNPGTHYRYRVYAQEVLDHKGIHVTYGNVAATDVYSKAPLTFLTADPKRQNVSFAMLNDIHANNEMLTQLVGLCDMKKTDFVLFNGDMVSIFDNEKQVFDGFMDTATKLFASETPMYYTRGNHETRGIFATEFQKYFSPTNQHIYYMFRQGPVCFIALDSGEDKPDNDIEYAGITDYDQYRTEEAAWLKDALESKEFLEAPFKVVTCHIPPFGGWHGNQEVAQKFIPLLEKANIDVLLCGHLHKYFYKKAGEAASFPIIVNSNNTVLKAQADSHKLNILVLDNTGKKVDEITIAK